MSQLVGVRQKRAGRSYPTRGNVLFFPKKYFNSIYARQEFNRLLITREIALDQHTFAVYHIHFEIKKSVGIYTKAITI